MDPTNITKFGNLERAMSLRWSLTLLSAFSFIDLYGLINFGVGLSEVSTSWVSSNIGVSEIAALLLTFSVTFGIAIPGASFLITAIFGMFFLKIKFYLQEHHDVILHESIREVRNDPSYIDAEKYRRWAVLNSNSAAYRDYERALSDKSDQNFIRYMCRCCLLISAFPLFLSDTIGLNGESYLQVFYAYIENTHWLIEYPIKLGVSCFGLFLLGVGFSDESHYDDYIRLENHNIES